MAHTTVSVLIPLLDDIGGIGRCLDAVVSQRTDSCRITEIVVADGGSTDGSRDVVAEWPDPRVQLLDNPDRYVPGAMNRALGASTGEVIVRVDSHTTIEPDYVETAVQVLEETGADAVGGPMRPVGATPFGEAVAWALRSPWGIGGSRFHDETHEGPVDSAYMGVFPRRTFERVGGYDPAFVRNQDDELTYRIREQGGTVWLSPRIRSHYEPRGTIRALVRQFRGYGRFKPLVLLTHPSGLRLRHLAPPAVVLAWLAAGVGLVAGERQRLLTVPAAAHLVAVAAAAGTGDGRYRDRVVALLGMHLGYGAGFLEGLADVLRGARSAGPPDVSAAAGPSPAAQPPGAT